MAILSVNAGSSTLKFSLHPLRHGQVQPVLLTGKIQGLEPGGAPELSWTYEGQSRRHGEPSRSFSHALTSLRELLESLPHVPAIRAVAHRVVHGGESFSASVVVDDAVLTDLARFNSLAPLHQPHNLEGIRAFAKVYPLLPQIACFDTAYHTTIPAVARAFALPAAVTDLGVRRYGFHGLSYQYIMQTLLDRTPDARGRVLMAHLGNGASLCAAIDGKSCGTTMGFSTLDGLMMGTRSGTLDAGVLLYLLEQGWDHKRLERLLYKESGLLGVSGISADMRRLRADGSEPARRAIEQFSYRVLREAGALVACMGGLDMLAFSGGIGEHDVQLRQEVGDALAWMGMSIDPSLNARATGDAVLAIHQPNSRVQVWVVPTNEGLVAAREAATLLG